MEGWRSVLEEGAEQLEPSAVTIELSKEEPAVEEGGDRSAEMTQIMEKKEQLQEFPPRVPKFQYADFPSLHQCIQQLPVPPIDSVLPGTPQRRAHSSQGTTASEEKVPKFRYVDYPFLHQCIQHLSVPPLENYSFGLPRPENNRVRTDSRPPLSPSAAVVYACSGYSVELGNKHDPALPALSPSSTLSLHSVITASTTGKLQPALCTSSQHKARSLIHSVMGQHPLEKAGSARLLKRQLGPKSRFTCTALNRKTVPQLSIYKRGLPVRSLDSGINSVEKQHKETFSDTKQLLIHQKIHHNDN